MKRAWITSSTLVFFLALYLPLCASAADPCKQLKRDLDREIDDVKAEQKSLLQSCNATAGRDSSECRILKDEQAQELSSLRGQRAREMAGCRGQGPMMATVFDEYSIFDKYALGSEFFHPCNNYGDSYQDCPGNSYVPHKHHRHHHHHPPQPPASGGAGASSGNGKKLPSTTAQNPGRNTTRSARVGDGPSRDNPPQSAHQNGSGSHGTSSGATSGVSHNSGGGSYSGGSSNPNSAGGGHSGASSGGFSGGSSAGAPSAGSSGASAHHDAGARRSN